MLFRDLPRYPVDLPDTPKLGDTLSMASPQNIAGDFAAAATLAGVSISASEIEIVELAAPHRRPASLPKGKLAVYVFIYGDRCLKVGKAGQRSAARYCSQHYGMNAPSTLAKSLLVNQRRIGVSGLNEGTVGEWICQNTRRVNFLLPSSYGVFLLSLLEAFVQCRFNPEFEGFESQRSVPQPTIQADVPALGGHAA
jgi:hypothetical protein